MDQHRARNDSASNGQFALCLNLRMTRRRQLIAIVVAVIAAASVLVAGWRAGRAVTPKLEGAAHRGAERAADAGLRPDVASRHVMPVKVGELLNAEDLFDAFERARGSDRPDAWLTARRIAEVCVGVTSDATVRNSIDEAIGELNSTAVMALDRDQRLLSLSQRKAALNSLEQGCRKFRGFGRTWARGVAQHLAEKARDSNGEIGRLLRASEQVSRGAGNDGEWLSALAAALASDNEAAEELAIEEMGKSLFDRRLAPGNRPTYSALGALKEAWWQVRGKSGQDRMADFDRLLLCVSGGSCPSAAGPALQPERAPGGEHNMDPEYWDVVAQYAEGLRRNDPEMIFRVQPRR
ncbi:MAG: hypothetical protein OHK0044_15960 [Burkholderiaceae bacterium]